MSFSAVSIQFPSKKKEKKKVLQTWKRNCRFYYIRHLFSIGKEIQAIVTCCPLLEDHICPASFRQGNEVLMYTGDIWFGRIYSSISAITKGYYKSYNHFDFSMQGQACMDKIMQRKLASFPWGTSYFREVMLFLWADPNPWEQKGTFVH